MFKFPQEALDESEFAYIKSQNLHGITGKNSLFHELRMVDRQRAI
jgi:hypothetical protein